MARTAEECRPVKECSECGIVKPIKNIQLVKCQNCWSKQKRHNNPRCYLQFRHSQIKQRCMNPRQQSAKYYNGLEVCDRDSFVEWSMSDSAFPDLFQVWFDSGREYKLTPSIDRIDVSGVYVLGNLQWITHSENCIKDQEMCAVQQFSKTGEFVSEYISQSFAEQATGISQQNISKVILGERKTAGGYIWKRKPE